MKRIRNTFFTFCFILALVISSLPLSAAASAYSDVPDDAWYLSHVEHLSSMNILGGTGGGKFSPKRNITRAEFTAMLAKTVLTEAEIAQYKGIASFNDVSTGEWFAPYIRWAYENGIVAGYEGNRFKPNQVVSRQEMAKMIVNFADKMGYNFQNTTSADSFKDQSAIADWALSSVQKCQTSGIIQGYKDGSFGPGNSTIRSEAATMYDRFLTNASQNEYIISRKRVNGFSVSAATFDPRQYNSSMVTGNNHPNGAETMSSMVNRTGAKFAMNAAYFDMSTYVPNATIVNNWVPLTIDLKNTPDKAAFVVNGSGAASIQHFRLNQVATLTTADGTQHTFESVISNRKPSNGADSSRIIFTPAWGTSVQFDFPASNFIAVDSDGYVVDVGHNIHKINIPEGGFVLYQKTAREADEAFFLSCSIGDAISVSYYYNGSDEGDVKTAVAAGPRIVKGGAKYANYAAEGYTASDITQATRKRVAIGINADGKVVMLTTTCTMSQLSDIMISLGCVDAINFDGGASSGLYCDGRWLSTPDRKLNNMIAFG